VICSYTKEIPKPITQANTVELCEKCGAAMVKQFNTFGIQFKGTGFYKTDNAK
jgi:predicted nucleic acid-binding Zn ribbon protein